MKKDTVIYILLALLTLAGGSAIYYYIKSDEASVKAWELKVKPINDFYEEKQHLREFWDTIPYNYLTESDINCDAVELYKGPSMFPEKGVSRMMAARIAEAVWFTQFGEKIIRCRPYSVTFSEGKWIVTANHVEGVSDSAYIEIDPKDGRIIRYICDK